MSEVSHRIPVEDFHLEALYQKGRTAEVAILCHPHPLYGGSMDNNVVSALMKAMHQWGCGTLRFNFRGVGGSGGEYGEGRGEVEDVMAATSFMLQQGHTAVHLAGYSFGAWIALKALRRGLDVSSLVLVSPPLDMLSFGDLSLPSKPCLVTLGDRDEFCALGSLKKWISSQSSTEPEVRLEVVAGCDHFYWGKEEILASKVFEFLQSRLPSHASEKNREQGC